ncbi:unnamed protein product, partial [Staurois parvus]
FFYTDCFYPIKAVKPIISQSFLQPLRNTLRAVIGHLVTWYKGVVKHCVADVKGLSLVQTLQLTSIGAQLYTFPKPACSKKASRWPISDHFGTSHPVPV